MPAVFAPLPKMTARHELQSGDLIVMADGGLAFFLMAYDENRSERSRCSLSLSTFKLDYFQADYAGLIIRDFVIAVDPSRAAPPNSPEGGEIAITANDAPMFVTGSGKGVAFDLAGNKNSVSYNTAIFPHWTIAIADGFGGRREIYAR